MPSLNLQRTGCQLTAPTVKNKKRKNWSNSPFDVNFCLYVRCQIHPKCCNYLLSSHLINQFMLSTHVVKTTNTAACNSDWQCEGRSWTHWDRDTASFFRVGRHILTPVMPTLPISPQTSSIQIVSKPASMFVQGRFLSIPVIPITLFYYCLVH